MNPEATSQAQSAEHGPPPEILRRIRAAGPVIDKELAQSLYAPLHASQQRAGVEILRDLAYGESSRQKLDLYRPSGHATGPLPCLVFLHGGGFIRGDKAEKENIGLYFAQRGFIAALANYRLAPASTWPAGAEDVVTALGWMRGNASRHGVDIHRLFVGGESAGAAHVAAAVLMRRFHPAGGLGVAGAVLVSGVYDVELEAKARRQFGIATPDPRNDAYFGADPARYAEMSTVRNVDALPLPVLITYAELDPMQMQVQAGELFGQLAGRKGYSPDLHVVRSHNHLTQVYAVNTGDESLSGPIVRFMRQPA